MPETQPPSFHGEQSNHSNFVSLRDYFESRIRDVERSAEKAEQFSDRAVVLANNALSNRLDLLNEFRGAMKDQTGTFVPRQEFDNLRKAYQDDDKAMRESLQAEIKSMQRTLYTLVGALAAIQVIVTFLATKVFN